MDITAHPYDPKKTECFDYNLHGQPIRQDEHVTRVKIAVSVFQLDAVPSSGSASSKTRFAHHTATSITEED